MKQIGAEIGVNESRVSQLHARAIRRLKEQLGEMNPHQVAEMRRQLVAFTAKPKMAKVEMAPEHQVTSPHAVVLTYKPAAKRTVMRVMKVGHPRQAVAAAR
jgi:hypothetical protein